MRNKSFQKLPKITEDVAQQVWMLKTVDDKKAFLLDYMGENYNNDEQEAIRFTLAKATSTIKIDELVTNMMLKTEGMGTFRS